MLPSGDDVDGSMSFMGPLVIFSNILKGVFCRQSKTKSPSSSVQVSMWWVKKGLSLNHHRLHYTTDLAKILDSVRGALVVENEQAKREIGVLFVFFAS